MAHSFLIERVERILLDDSQFEIRGQNLVDVVPREAPGGLGEIVGAEGEELRFLRDLIGHQCGPGQFDHGADHVFHGPLFLREHFFRNAVHDLGLVRHLFERGGQRDHDFREHLDALFRHDDSRFENGARLHLGNLRIGDAETAAAVSEHGVELVQLLDAGEQRRQKLLQIADHLRSVVFVLPHQRLLLLRVNDCQRSDIDHQVLAARQELMQRRIEGSDRNREAIHGAEHADKVVPLHG